MLTHLRSFKGTKELDIQSEVVNSVWQDSLSGLKIRFCLPFQQENESCSPSAEHAFPKSAKAKEDALQLTNIGCGISTSKRLRGRAGQAGIHRVLGQTRRQTSQSYCLLCSSLSIHTRQKVTDIVSTLPYDLKRNPRTFHLCMTKQYLLFFSSPLIFIHYS